MKWIEMVIQPSQTRNISFYIGHLLWCPSDDLENMNSKGYNGRMVNRPDLVLERLILNHHQVWSPGSLIVRNGNFQTQRKAFDEFQANFRS
jgi:hypothetical protein